jgi:glutamyl-tRNA reductase
MKLVCVGINWKTPVRIRERLAFDGPKVAEALPQLRDSSSGLECVILSTCNRTEIYTANSRENRQPCAEASNEFLAQFHKLPRSEFADHLYSLEDWAAAEHLFSVAAGLDSLVLGETQILGQVKLAYQWAVEQQTAGPILHSLFQRALGAGKRVHNETALSRGRLSIASAAVDYIRGVFDEFDDKSLLVIGAGKMAELVLTHLKELAPKTITVCNRTTERADKLVARLGGRVRPFEELRSALIEADIVISSTGAEQPLLFAPEFQGIMAARRHRLVAILDIAVPRDFDPEIARIDNVLLWNIDDLEKVAYRTLRQRERELNKALRIIEEETRAFQASLAFQQTSPVIGKLDSEYQRIIDQELGWLWPQLNGVADEHRDKIRQFAHRLKNKLLHLPKSALRAEASAGRHHGLVDALRRLFGLDDV